MKIFEFSFNPKKRKDRFFEIYSYEPRSPKEKPKGTLYMVGELDNALEFNSRLLKRLRALIQQEYYGSSLKAGAAFKAALKRVNGFLEQESKNGNVDWLGNLHVALLLFLTVGEKKTVFHAAKTGSMKILLVRQGMLTDAGKRGETGSLRQPGKVFSNLVSGTLLPEDSVIATTREIFEVLSREKSLLELGALGEARQFREFFSKRVRMLSQNSGVLIAAVIEQEQAKRSLPKPRIMFPLLHYPFLAKRLLLILFFLGVLLLGYLFF